MVEGQVKEQGLARDGLESRWEVHEAGLLGDEGRVQAECLKPFNQGLESDQREELCCGSAADEQPDTHRVGATPFGASVCDLM